MIQPVSSQHWPAHMNNSLSPKTMPPPSLTPFPPHPMCLKCLQWTAWARGERATTETKKKVILNLTELTSSAFPCWRSTFLSSWINTQSHTHTYAHIHTHTHPHRRRSALWFQHATYFFRWTHLSLIAFLCLLFRIGTCPRKSSAAAPPLLLSFQRGRARRA